MKNKTNDRLWKLAGECDCIFIELEQLADLLQVYSEHREKELEGLKIESRGEFSFVLNRRGLGDALMDALDRKVYGIKDQAEQVCESCYALAREVRAAVENKNL